MITADQPMTLVFEPLGDGAWRLCDAGADENDASHLVAYVERVDSGDYSAIWLGLGLRPTLHASRDDVLRTAQLLRADPASTRSKPVPIPHLNPVRTGPLGRG